jgi:hypothetical protein
MTEMKSKAHSFKETRRLEICINANRTALEMAMDGTFGSVDEERATDFEARNLTIIGLLLSSCVLSV